MKDTAQRDRILVALLKKALADGSRKHHAVDALNVYYPAVQTAIAILEGRQKILVVNGDTV